MGVICRLVLDRFRCRRRAHAHVSRHPCLDRPCLHTLTGHASAIPPAAGPMTLTLSTPSTLMLSTQMQVPSGLQACQAIGPPDPIMSPPSGGLAFRLDCNRVIGPDSSTANPPMRSTLRTAGVSQAQATRRRFDDCARLLPGLWSGQAGQRTGSMSQSPAMHDAPRTVPTASRVISPLQAGWPSDPIIQAGPGSPCRRRRRRNCRRRRRRDVQPRDLRGTRAKQGHAASDCTRQP